MNVQKFFALRSYLHDQCVNNKITWEQFISANYILQTLYTSFPEIKPPEIKTENEIFIFRWSKEEDYLEFGVNLLGAFVWKIYFKSAIGSSGHLGFGLPHINEQGNVILWPLIWTDEKGQKYLHFFSEKNIK